MDDTLNLMKEPNIPIVLQALIGLYKNPNFTVHTFEDEKIYFFDLLIDTKTRDIVHENTHTH